MEIEKCKNCSYEFLDENPELLTVNQVAEILKVKANTVYGLHGLVRIRIGEGRGLIRYRKIDLINYIKSREEEEINLDAYQKTERQRKMGVSPLLSRKELQTLCLEYKGRGTEGGGRPFK
jgi:hypothetical protein